MNSFVPPSFNFLSEIELSQTQMNAHTQKTVNSQAFIDQTNIFADQHFTGNTFSDNFFHSSETYVPDFPEFLEDCNRLTTDEGAQLLAKVVFDQQMSCPLTAPILYPYPSQTSLRSPTLAQSAIQSLQYKPRVTSKALDAEPKIQCFDPMQSVINEGLQGGGAREIPQSRSPVTQNDQNRLEGDGSRGTCQTHSPSKQNAKNGSKGNVAGEVPKEPTCLMPDFDHFLQQLLKVVERANSPKSNTASPAVSPTSPTAETSPSTASTTPSCGNETRTISAGLVDVGKALEEAAFDDLHQEEEPVEPAKQTNTLQKSAKRAKISSFHAMEFERISFEKEANLQATNSILAKFKILGIDEDINAVKLNRRYGLAAEKKAILSMPNNFTLDTGKKLTNLPLSAYLKAVFDSYDRDEVLKQVTEIDDRQNINQSSNKGGFAGESCERAFLLVAVLIYRHSFMYKNRGGLLRLGVTFTGTFENHLPPSSMGRHCATRDIREALLLKKARALCRIIVACGHPCIILVLVRLCNRLRINLSTLLEQLHIEELCQWIASGQVSPTRLCGAPRSNVESYLSRRGEKLEEELLEAHREILLPLLAIARQRCPDKIIMFDGQIECSVDTCIASIVYGASQDRYFNFIKGNIYDDLFAKGKFMIGTSIKKGHKRVKMKQGDAEEENECKSQYTIETKKRTFNVFNIPNYANRNDRFTNPKGFLVNQVMDMGLDY